MSLVYRNSVETYSFTCTSIFFFVALVQDVRLNFGRNSNSKNLGGLEDATWDRGCHFVAYHRANGTGDYLRRPSAGFKQRQRRWRNEVNEHRADKIVYTEQAWHAATTRVWQPATFTRSIKKVRQQQWQFHGDAPTIPEQVVSHKCDRKRHY